MIPFLSCAFLLVAACNKSKETKPQPDRENVKGEILVDQPQSLGNWFIKDPYLNQLEGVSSEKSQTDFNLKNQKEIIVAVIDSGVDINHVDLKNKIWNNPGEVGLDSQGHDKRTNQIDDDQNGFIDDVYGWNFIGSADGKHVSYDTLEVTRESLRYDLKIADGEKLTEAEIKYFEVVNKDYQQQFESAQKNLKELLPIEAIASVAQNILKNKIKLEDFSEISLQKIASTDPEVMQARKDLLDVVAKFRTVARFFRIFKTTQADLDYFLNKQFDARKIVGDDPNDFTQVHYGNNDVMGPDASHGTHVAGIIAAESGNGIGIDGVAQNVKIMVLKVVPNGDERDKDVALAVRYAVNNGAHVINMSFGKSYSPFKSKIDAEFLKAAEKGILIFHAAGNEASNNDDKAGYPNRNVQDAAVLAQPEKISTWLEVGASTSQNGLGLVASFSDYGQKDVDLFSPGYEINSTIPGDQYAVYSGTSMAAPVAAGVGALLMSNFENMTGAQAKAILLHEVRTYPNLLVHLPGSEKLDLPVPFKTLSATGGVIDAYRSIRFAKELSQ